MKLSIIIPVFNEAKTLKKTLNSLQSLREEHELIIVDGKSDDESWQIAESHCDKLISCQRGRAIQMNTGAMQASGDTLLFLHADTFLPDKLNELLTLPVSPMLWGRFDLGLSGKKKIFRLIEYMINLRSRLTGIATGDQAIFVNVDLFKLVGGYKELELMEDIALCKRLKKIAKPVCLKSRVITSSRRWEDKGVFKTIVLMWSLRFLYFIGVSPKTLNRIYVQA